MYIHIYTYIHIHIALWHVWIEPDSLDLASMKAYMCRYLYIHLIIVCISAYAAPVLYMQEIWSTQLYSCWNQQKQTESMEIRWSLPICIYIYNLFPAGQATGGPGGPAIDDPVVYSRSTLWAGQHVPSGVLRDADSEIIGSNESNPWWIAVNSPFDSFKIYWPWLWGLCTMYSENLSMSSHGLPK